MKSRLLAQEPELGFGYMRLPHINGNIDLDAANQMVDTFLSYGFTYFDTAYSYPGAEEALRESLVKRHKRDSFEIATKLYIPNIEKPEQQKEQFETSLTRLGVDFVDFYLIHDLYGKIINKAYELNTWDFMKQLKKEGYVKHIGFSFHGTAEELEGVLSRNPELEFLYLQINYLDWNDRRVQSRLCYEIARKYKKPIFVMEPAKGGLLAGNESDSANLLKQVNPDASVASWAFRFAGGLEGVTTVLSGMGTIKQINDNANTFRNFKRLSQKENDSISEAVSLINSIPRIPCTSCRYCMPHCPQKIWIPQIIEDYNDLLIHKTVDYMKFKYKVTMMGVSGTQMKDCTKCRKCEEHCPQHIKISEIIQEMADRIN